MGDPRNQQLAKVLAGVALSANASLAAGCLHEQTDQFLQLGNYKAALLDLRQCADLGDSRAQLLLGHLYLLGQGVIADEYIAAEFIRKAALGGNLNAQYQLGMLYLEGIGLTENSHQALHWISSAAAKAHPDAKATLDYILAHDAPLAC